MGKGAWRIPALQLHGSLAGAARPWGECSAGPTHGGSRREATWKLGAVGSLRTPSRAIRLARQMHHAACSMLHASCSRRHAPCNGHATEMQLPPCTRRQHVGSDALCRIVPFGQRQRQRQSHAKDAPTNALWPIRVCRSTQRLKQSQPPQAAPAGSMRRHTPPSHTCASRIVPLAVLAKSARWH